MEDVQKAINVKGKMHRGNKRAAKIMMTTCFVMHFVTMKNRLPKSHGKKILRKWL